MAMRQYSIAPPICRGWPNCQLTLAQYLRENKKIVPSWRFFWFSLRKQFTVRAGHWDCMWLFSNNFLHNGRKMQA
jgi:hypothetical protein